MAIDINHCMLEGRLGADPESTITSGGSKFCRVRIAVNDDYKDKNQQWQKRAYWITLSAAGRTADELEQYRKGDRVLVIGKWTVEEYTDRNQKRQFFNKLFVLSIRGTDRRFAQEDARDPPARTNQSAPAQQRQAPSGSADGFDDDIPF